MNQHPGVFGRKLGMTQVFSADGSVIACTVVESKPVVVAKRTKAQDGYDAIVLGIEERGERHVNKPLGGFYKKANVSPKGTLREPSRWLPVEQAALSYGYGIAVTPVQLARAYAAIANGGVAMPLTLLKREVPPNGSMLRSAMNVRIARELQAMIEAATSASGTGTRAQVSKLPAWMWMDAPTVARQGFDAVMDGVPIYINGRANRAIEAFVRHLPQAVVMWAGRRLGRSYRKT
jgi:hypothetical protein